MTISIIGCGWLGFPLAKHLLTKGHTVKGSTTTPEKLSQLKKVGIQPFLITLDPALNGTNLTDFFTTDLLIINIPPRRRIPNIIEIYPQSIKNLVERIQSHNIKKVIFASSTGVYANTNDIVTEATIPQPITNSGKAVLKAENILKTIDNLELTILRFAGLVGGSRKAGRFLAGKRNLANGNAPVNLVHQLDCIQIISAIIEQDVWQSTFNACADKHPIRKVFYAEQARKQGFEVPHFLENDTPSFKIVSNQKIKTALNYRFSHPNPMLF